MEGVQFFSALFNHIDIKDISDIHKYLMKKYDKTMLVLIKKIFIGVLNGQVNGSNHTKCVSLSNKKCMTQPTFIDLPNKYSQEFHYYPFSVHLDRYVGSCNTLNDLSNKVCVPNKTEDLNLSIFNMTTGINELKTLTKHISCKCKCRFDERKCNSDQWWNNKCRHECENVMCVKKIMFGILLHVIVKMEDV